MDVLVKKISFDVATGHKTPFTVRPARRLWPVQRPVRTMCLALPRVL